MTAARPSWVSGPGGGGRRCSRAWFLLGYRIPYHRRPAGAEVAGRQQEEGSGQDSRSPTREPAGRIGDTALPKELALPFTDTPSLPAQPHGEGQGAWRDPAPTPAPVLHWLCPLGGSPVVGAGH